MIFTVDPDSGIDQTDRFLHGTAARSGDPGHSKNDIGSGCFSNSVEHFMAGLFTDCAVNFQCLRRDMQDLFFELSGIGNDAAEEDIG